MVTNSTNLSKLNNHLSPQIIGYENKKDVPTLRSSSDSKCVLPQQMLD